MPRSSQAREATVYDAVAERIDYQGFIQQPKSSGARASDVEDSDTSSLQSSPIVDIRRGAPVTPDEALFRQRNAPDRYEEDEIYSADRNLRPDQQLPDSDLLKAIHAYVSDFWSRATLDGGADDMQSMDETALLACGILLEEACKDLLGPRSDMVLTEGDDGGNLAEYGLSRRMRSAWPEVMDEDASKRPRIDTDRNSRLESPES